MKRSRLAIIAMLIGLSSWMLFYAIFGQHGYLQIAKLHKQLIQLNKDNKEMVSKNHFLSEEIDRLDKSPAYFERYIRLKTSLVRQNEIIYQFK